MIVLGRRPWLLGIAAVPAITWAGPPGEADPAQQRMQNRLDLWRNYAKRTQTLVVRYASTRKSSLLQEPLLSTGMLGFRAPDTLVFADDGLTGSTTLLTPETLAIHPNQAGGRPVVESPPLPAAVWLREKLIRAFAPGDGTELLADARSEIPRGKGYLLQLMPPFGSPIRKVLRSVLLRLDPVAGAVIALSIEEAQGDSILFQFSDHRQNPDPAELAPIFAKAKL